MMPRWFQVLCEIVDRGGECPDDEYGRDVLADLKARGLVGFAMNAWLDDEWFVVPTDEGRKVVADWRAVADGEGSDEAKHYLVQIQGEKL